MSVTDAEDRITCYGSPEPEPEALILTAGALTVEFIAGNLRDIRFNGVEVLRAVGYIVRDKDWGTYAPLLSNLRTQREADLFHVSYDAQCSSTDGAALVYSATISGGPTVRSVSTSRRGRSAIFRPIAAVFVSCTPSLAWPARRLLSNM